MINEANIFNRFELVIETLQKTAPKKQIYLKSSLFHLLILCKDQKLCICAMPNKLFFIYELRDKKWRGFSVWSLWSSCLQCVLRLREVSWYKSKPVTCYVVFPLCPWLSKSTASNQEYLSSSAEAIFTDFLWKRGSTSTEVSAVAGKIEGFLFSPRGYVASVHQ